jgi:PKD repeat protein
MKKILLAGLLLIVVLFSIGCAQKAAVTSNHDGIVVGSSGRGGPATYTVAPMTTSAVKPQFVVPNQPAMPSGIATQAAEDAFSPANGIQYSAAAPTDRMVVKTGNLQIVVSQISVALDGINQVAARYGGYVVNSQQWKEGDRNIGNISIRVLAENYDKALADIRTIAKSVTSESTSSQDVTQEYTDLDAQIKNLQATETQLLKIMETATKTEDILSIQRELTNVRGQIEQIKGRMLYLERTSSTSLININLEEAVLALKFSADKVSGGTGEGIKFSSEVIGGFAPYNYTWDFGDGKNSSEASPTHTYAEAGTYTVALKVVDDKGYTNSLTRDGYISIIGSWKPGSVAHSAWSGFMAFGRGLVNFLIWVGIFSPVWIVIGVLIWYFGFHRRHKRQMK